MDNCKAFLMGYLTRNNSIMVFDWDKAAELIREYNPSYAAAGLQGDWGCTGGCIWDEGNPVFNDYTFLASTWATPELKMDNQYIPCYRMENEVPGWGAETKWPKSALEIVSKRKEATPV